MFRNAETGFAVIRAKAWGERDLVPLVGHAAPISAGEDIQAADVTRARSGFCGTVPA